MLRVIGAWLTITTGQLLHMKLVIPWYKFVTPWSTYSLHCLISLFLYEIYTLVFVEGYNKGGVVFPLGRLWRARSREISPVCWDPRYGSGPWARRGTLHSKLLVALHRERESKVRTVTTGKLCWGLWGWGWRGVNHLILSPREFNLVPRTSPEGFRPNGQERGPRSEVEKREILLELI